MYTCARACPVTIFSVTSLRSESLYELLCKAYVSHPVPELPPREFIGSSAAHSTWSQHTPTAAVRQLLRRVEKLYFVFKQLHRVIHRSQTPATSAACIICHHQQHETRRCRHVQRRRDHHQLGSRSPTQRQSQSRPLPPPQP